MAVETSGSHTVDCAGVKSTNTLLVYLMSCGFFTQKYMITKQQERGDVLK